MVGRYSVAHSTRLLSLSLLLASYLAPAETVTCYSCSYTYTSSHLSYECINATEKVKTASIVSCSGNFCKDRVVYKKHEKNEFVVSSAVRSCHIGTHQGPECTQSLFEITCTYICNGTNCNNRNLAYRKPPSGNASAAFTHWIAALGAVANILLNLII